MWGMKRRFAPFLVTVLAMALLAGCTGQKAPAAADPAPASPAPAPAPAPAAPPKPIKIGAIFSSTGGASSLGKPEHDTVVLLTEQINKAGGIGGRPIELVFLDSESDETKAVLAMKKLAGDPEIVGIVGGTTSGESLAMLPEAGKNEVTFISVAASIKIVEPVSKWVFKTPATDREVVEAIVRHLKANGLLNVAWMSVNNAFGDSGRVEFERLAKDAGIKIIANERFNHADADMTAQVTKVKAANPQAVVVWATPPSASVVASNIHQLGLKVPQFQSHGISNKAFIDQAGAGAEGIIFPAQKLAVWETLPANDPLKGVTTEYVNAFQAKYNYFPTTFGAHAYDGFMMLVKAIEAVGTDRAKIRDHIEGLKSFVTAGGVFNMSPTDHMGLTANDIVLVQIKDGKWVRFGN